MFETLRKPLLPIMVGAAMVSTQSTAEAVQSGSLDHSLVAGTQVGVQTPHEFITSQTKPRPQNWGPDRIAAPDVFLQTVPIARVALRSYGFKGNIGFVPNSVSSRYPKPSKPERHILVSALTHRVKVPEKVNGSPTGEMVDKYVNIKPGKNISNKRQLFLKLGEFTIIEDRSVDGSSLLPFQSVNN